MAIVDNEKLAQLKERKSRLNEEKLIPERERRAMYDALNAIWSEGIQNVLNPEDRIIICQGEEDTSIFIQHDGFKYVESDKDDVYDIQLSGRHAFIVFSGNQVELYEPGRFGKVTKKGIYGMLNEGLDKLLETPSEDSI